MLPASSTSHVTSTNPPVVATATADGTAGLSEKSKICGSAGVESTMRYSIAYAAPNRQENDE